MDYATAILQLVNEGFFEGVPLWHNGNLRDAEGNFIDYATLDIRNDSTQASVKPSEQALIDAYARWELANSASQSQNSERLTILEKAALANEYMPDIRKVLNAIIDHDITSDDQLTRITALAIIVHTQVSTAFRNRFYAALKAEQNLDVLALGIQNLSLAQQRIFLTYLRIFTTQYALLALFGSMQT